MKNKIIQGFELVEERSFDELSAVIYEYKHQKTGASLIHIDREDENKTFAIGFSTPPTTDTGVFHIIEHSVLCGSEKYPPKDPFAELLKSSLNTFLNAITYEDRTVYPVSSRCERDFFNLMDVYLDAVFAPNLLKNPNIFRQEGWHYEYDEESDKLSYNGVVYNEMKGAYSSADEVGNMALMKELFSDSVYCRDSGGNPSDIPTLTYEQFKATYEKHYHPTASKIVLDGRINIDEALKIIDSHLCRFDYKDNGIRLDSMSKPKICKPVTIPFEFSESESPEGRARVLFGYVYSDFKDKEAHLTATILSDFLCGSNTSPLKKALLDSGHAKDVMMYSSKARQNTMIIEVRDVNEDDFEKIESTVNDVLEQVINEGIDKERLNAILNYAEFKFRERDYGSLPSGIAYALSMMGHWMYGATPEEAIAIEAPAKAIRAKIGTDYFESFLNNLTLSNNHKAVIIMTPDSELGKRNVAETEKKLAKIRSSLSKDELEMIKNEENALQQWQESEDSDEALASVPKLELSDVPTVTPKNVTSVYEINGVKILKNDIKTSGIVYISLLFDASDLKSSELFQLSVLSSALLNFKTANHTPLSLQSDIKANLGSLFASVAVGTKDGVSTPYLKIGASALLSKQDDLIRLISETVNTSEIDDSKEIASILAQARSQLEDAIIADGSSIGLARVEASLSESASMLEYILGYEAYRILCDLLKNPEKIEGLTADLALLLKKLAVKNRLTVSIAGEVDSDFTERLISVFPNGEATGDASSAGYCASNSEFFVIPSKVAYAVLGGKCDEAEKNLGFMRVARSILSYEYLWNTIRVKNGAYGTGFVPRRDGVIMFYSYRDPSPENSIEYYKQSAEYLRAMAKGDCDLTKFIIGAVGEVDILTTPRTKFNLATNDYINGWSQEKSAEIRASMLKMQPSDLIVVADMIDKALENASLAVVGADEHLKAMKTPFKDVYKI